MSEVVPVYNLAGFLRVLYLRRWFIVIVTLLGGILAGALGMTRPEVYRAHTIVRLDVPNYKETLTLLPKPLTVSVVRSMLTDPDTMREVLERMAEINMTLDILKGDNAQKSLKEARATAELPEISGDAYETIAAATEGDLVNALLSGDRDLHALAREPERLWVSEDSRAQLLAILAAMNAGELRVIGEMTSEKISGISPYAMTRRLAAFTTITKETNLDTEYSPIIDVYGMAPSAVEAEAITNLWLRVFRIRAERAARELIVKEAGKIESEIAKIESRIQTIEIQRNEYLAQKQVEDAQQQLTAARLLLYGVAKETNETRSHRGAINVENPEETPFWKEQSSVSQTEAFVPTPQFGNSIMARLVAARVNGAPLAEIEKLEKQASALRDEIKSLQTSVLEHKHQLSVWDREKAGLQSRWEQLLPTYNEAKQLTSAVQVGGVADLDFSTAQKPDTRYSPNRKQMIVAGLAAGFLVACVLCFLLDLWSEVVKKPEQKSSFSL